MLRQLEGSRAVAETVARCRPAVVAAYPISPQTHIVERLSDLVTAGELGRCEYLMVESEFGALSACIGASGAGGRTYTATSSQGLLFMAEALPNASGLGLPIVMTLANRALGAPINIWNDHSDALSQRDAGWLQLFASSNQEAVDLHVQAFALAERLSLPVMVCMDGFVLTHAMERIDVPDQDEVDAFLPAFRPRQWLDPDEPVTIGAMVGPDAFTEVKYLAAHQQLRALEVVREVADRFHAAFGRDSGGLLHPYRTEDAEVVLVAMGSALGSAADVVDTLRDEGVPVGVLGITCYRPWPYHEVREALRGIPRVVVLNRAISVGAGSVLGADVRLSAPDGTAVHDVVLGLGGRPVTRPGLRQLFLDARDGVLPDVGLHFADLDHEVAARELSRQQADEQAHEQPREEASR
jgi:pyruvate ferredoxin oxidoreductase alpha subunit